MGKIFTIEFNYVNSKHNALVSISSDQQDAFVHIQLIDRYLQKVFATEHIRYKGNLGYKSLDCYKQPFTRELIDKIVTAIEWELMKNYAIIKKIIPHFF